MINFKLFLTEEINTPEPLKRVEYLTLDGHEGVSDTADMLSGVFDKLRGTSTNLGTVINYPGLPITFGIDPSDKQLYIEHDGKVNKTYDDIQQNHGEHPEVVRLLTAGADHIPKIIPPGKVNTYQGVIIGTNNKDTPPYITPSAAKLRLAVTGDKNGNPLRSSSRAKFIQHPDVYNIDPTLSNNPAQIDPASTQDYLQHMKLARDVYSRMDPAAIDAVAAHSGALEDYIDLMNERGTEPPSLTNKSRTYDYSESYLDYMTRKYADQAEKAKSDIGMGSKNKRFSMMASQIVNNDKNFEHVIKILWNFKRAKSVLGNVAARTTPNDITLFSGDKKAILDVI